MDIKKILVIAIIALAVFSCLSAVSAGWFDFLGGDKYLVGDGAQVKVPSNYTVDDKKIAASCKDINITLTPQKSSDDKLEKEFFGAVKSNGKSAGYENVTNKIKALNAYIEKHHVSDYKSKLVTCPNCGSKIATDWLDPNKHNITHSERDNCPVCHSS